MKRVLLKVCFSFVAISLLIVSGGIYWIDQQFEEPDAKLVSSIAGELGSQSVLAVFAHPDDEQLVTGFLIRSVEMDGAVTNMVTATKGERGQQVPVNISRKVDQGVVRKAETLMNSYALGVSEHEVWDYPDGLLKTADEDAIRQSVRSAMLKYQPDTILTFWPDSGFTGHKDHQLIGRLALEVAEELNKADPLNGPQNIVHVLAPRSMMLKLGGETGKFVVENQPAPTHAMPGEGWAKIRGWDIHQSQSGFVQAIYGVPPWIVHRLYDKEHYFVRSF